jgi:hypothetical protein
VFVAAGHDARCLEYIRRSNKFKPPARPTLVRTERAMSYVLAAHRAEGLWTEAQVDKAWKIFLDSNVIRWDFRVDHLALWMKMRYWDDHRERSPCDAFLMLYEHLPGVEPPTMME